MHKILTIVLLVVIKQCLSQDLPVPPPTNCGCGRLPLFLQERYLRQTDKVEGRNCKCDQSISQKAESTSAFENEALIESHFRFVRATKAKQQSNKGRSRPSTTAKTSLSPSRIRVHPEYQFPLQIFFWNLFNTTKWSFRYAPWSPGLKGVKIDRKYRQPVKVRKH